MRKARPEKHDWPMPSGDARPTPDSSSSDPQFVQRQIDPLTGDRTLSMLAEHPAARDMRERMRERRRDFTERFGREPGPEDPLFFDPANVPTAMSPETATAEFDTMLDNIASRIDDPMLRAQLRAAKDVGFIITESNMHLFSARDIDAWEDVLGPHEARRGEWSSAGDTQARGGDASTERAVVF